MAHVGKGTIYRHFGNKRELFLAVARFGIEQVVQFTRERVFEEFPGMPDPIAGLRAGARACASFYRDNPEWLEIIIQERAEFRKTVFPTIFTALSEVEEGGTRPFRRAIDEGRVRSDDPLAMLQAYNNTLMGTIIFGCLEGKYHELPERVDRAMEYFFEGACLKPSTETEKD